MGNQSSANDLIQLFLTVSFRFVSFVVVIGRAINYAMQRFDSTLFIAQMGKLLLLFPHLLPPTTIIFYFLSTRGLADLLFADNYFQFD